MKLTASVLIVLSLAAASCTERDAAQDGGTPPRQRDGEGPSGAATPGAAPAWAAAEAPLLSRPVQLTTRDRFIKAGEAYFGPGDWIVFQAVPVPKAGEKPEPFYSMYVARLSRAEDGRVTGLEEPIRISPEGSANTCGWFHPKIPGTVLFGSTITPPSSDQKAGFQVGARKYEWLFPQEMDLVTVGVREVFADIAGKEPRHPGGQPAPEPVFRRPEYDAECSYSEDGRFILYVHVREDKKPEERADPDIWVYDTANGTQHPLVTAQGYDGGPFFSPDGRSICYRSDRDLNDRLQLFVADLKFQNGVPVGVEREYQLTDNGAVNWAPYWHPSGRFIAYGTSELGHMNYEVFAIEVDRAKLAPDAPPPGSRAADTLRRGRVTHAPGADVLPVFSDDGKTMMWTSQRGPMVEGEQRPSSQLWIADFDAAALSLDIVGAPKKQEITGGTTAPRENGSGDNR